MFSRRGFLGVSTVTLSSLGAWFSNSSKFNRQVLNCELDSWGVDVTSESGGVVTVPLIVQSKELQMDELHSCEDAFIKDNPKTKVAYSYIINNDDGRYGILISDRRCRLV